MTERSELTEILMRTRDLHTIMRDREARKVLEDLITDLESKLAATSARSADC